MEPCITSRKYYLKHAAANVRYVLCRCGLCGVRFSSLICKECQQKMIFWTEPWCSVCGAKVKKKGDICSHCENMPYIYSLWQYDNTVRKIFLLYKKQGIHIFSAYLAWQVLPLLKTIIKTNNVNTRTYILSVPPHPKNKKKVGFDYIAAIASQISMYTSVKHVKHVMYRKKSGIQKTLARNKRFDNIEKSLHINTQAIKKIKADSKRYSHFQYIIFDDIVTTGATMAICYKKLRHQLPEAEMKFLSISRVRKHKM